MGVGGICVCVCVCVRLLALCCAPASVEPLGILRFVVNSNIRRC